jgi:copper(I)-binding protein
MRDFHGGHNAKGAKSVKRVATVLGSLVFVASAAAAGPAATGVQATDAYARAVPPGQPNSAMFMKLTNDSGTDRAVVGAESPVCKTAELHTHIHQGGMMMMRRIDRIDVPAGKTVALQPGGLHVMLIGLKKPLVPGESVDVTLIFADGSRQLVKGPVRRIAVPPMGGSHKPH